jgi:hypothetical protein
LNQALNGIENSSKIAGTAGTIAMMASYTNVVTATMTIVALYSGSQSSNQQEEMNKMLFEIFTQLDGIQKDLKQIHQEIRQISTKLDMLEGQIYALASQLNYMHQDLVSRISDMGPKLDYLIDGVDELKFKPEDECLNIYSKKLEDYKESLSRARKIQRTNSNTTPKNVLFVPFDYILSEDTLKTIVINRNPSYVTCISYLSSERNNFSEHSAHSNLREKSASVRARYGVSPRLANVQNDSSEYLYDKNYYKSIFYYYQQMLNRKIQESGLSEADQVSLLYKQEFLKILNPVGNIRSVFNKESLILKKDKEEFELPSEFNLSRSGVSVFDSIPLGEVLSDRLDPHRTISLSWLTMQMLPLYEYDKYIYDELNKYPNRRSTLLNNIKKNSVNYLSGSLTVLNASIFQEALLSGEVILKYLSSRWNEVQSPDPGDSQCKKPIAERVFSPYCLVQLNSNFAQNLLSYQLNEFFPNSNGESVSVTV